MRPSREAVMRRVAQRRAIHVQGSSASPLRMPESGLLRELRRVIAERNLLLEKKRKKIQVLRGRVEEERRRADAAEGVTHAYKTSYEELMSQVTEARVYADVQIADAVADYKSSADFAAEMEEAGAAGHEYGFDDCRSRIAELFPGLDLSGLDPIVVAPGVPSAMTVE